MKNLNRLIEESAGFGIAVRHRRMDEIRRVVQLGSIIEIPAQLDTADDDGGQPQTDQSR